MKSHPRLLALAGAAAALAHAAASAAAVVTIPSSASIHGAGGAFFHSDLWVVNRSFSNPISVTATYRCFAGSCPAAAQSSFTLAPRESRVFTDVDATLFSAPESAGAIELGWDDGLGMISATSRVYTPQLPAPTFGTGIPGLAASKAMPRAIFLGLGNNGGSLAAGFRSNAGAYNPNDGPVSVTFRLLEASGAALGSPVVRDVPARGAVQVNDVFAAAGAGSTVSTNVSMHATTSPSAPVFFIVTVIDNQSGDSIFVSPGTDAEVATAPPDIQTVPASASIHGNAGTFFHTDLWARNNSTTAPLTVSAQLSCSTGACPDAPKTFTLAPGETKEFADVVGTFFGAPEAAGGISLSPSSGFGKLLATSRTYTPSLPAPTNGTSIPGLPLTEVRTRALFLGLGTNGGNLTGGFRTNAGVYNPLPFTTKATFALYDASGSLLGTASRALDAYAAVQVNDIFGAVGAGATVTTNATLVVTAPLPVFAYVTVIDNQSGDSIFVAASDDEPAP